MIKYCKVLLFFLGIPLPHSSSFSTVSLAWKTHVPSRLIKDKHDHRLLRPIGQSKTSSKLKSEVLSPSLDLSLDLVEEEEQKLIGLIQSYKSSNSSLEKPSSAAFISLIEKWLIFPHPERAEAILDKMEELYTPSGRIYERIINAWSFRATEIINQMNNDWNEAPVPDETKRYEIDFPEEERNKMKMNMRQEATNCSVRAIQLLNRMEQLHQEIGDDFRPALSTYTSVINSITRTSQKDNASLASQKDVIERIRAKRDEIYKYLEMKRLPVGSIDDVFSIIKNLENSHQVMSKFRVDAELSPVPNLFNFNLIINALAQTGQPWAAQAAEDILDFMVDECQRGKQYLTPSIETFNGCMNAWAHCSTAKEEAASRAEAVLQKLTMLQTTNGILTNLSPDTVTYNTIIKAYANGSRAERAEAVLENLVALYNKTGDTRVRPDLISYSSVLKAYANAAVLDSNASKKSEEILMKMVKMQKENKTNVNTVRIVNTWCFNTVRIKF